MRGKWNHSTKPSQYEVFNEKNELIFSGSFTDAMNYMEQNKNEYILIDWNRPHGHERIPTNKTIILTKDEAHDLNKLLTLNGENKRYVKL